MQNNTIGVLTLTAAIVTKYYWENASGAIASSREHLNVQENAGRAATHGGLACHAGSWGWCARGPRIETRGSHHIIGHPISPQIGFFGSRVRVKNIFQEKSFSSLYSSSWTMVTHFWTPSYNNSDISINMLELADWLMMSQPHRVSKSMVNG